MKNIFLVSSLLLNIICNAETILPPSAIMENDNDNIIELEPTKVTYEITRKSDSKEINYSKFITEDTRFTVEEKAKLKAEKEAKLKAEKEAKLKAEKEAKPEAKKEAKPEAEKEAKLEDDGLPIAETMPLEEGETYPEI